VLSLIRTARQPGQHLSGRFRASWVIGTLRVIARRLQLRRVSFNLRSGPKEHFSHFPIVRHLRNTTEVAGALSHSSGNGVVHGGRKNVEAKTAVPALALAERRSAVRAWHVSGSKSHIHSGTL
jgi:hypothetical protein